MRISLIQFSIVPGNREANFEQARRHVQVAAADGADIAVLSELWDTSFYPSDVREKADEEGLLAQAFLQDLAKSCNIHIVGGSIARRHEGNLYNTTYVVRRDGSLVSSYDKCHLFTPGKEDKAFTAGKELNVFSLDGVTMASIICYDVRFGEWVRMAALAGAKILFVPAAWPEARLEHWQLLNRARLLKISFSLPLLTAAASAAALNSVVIHCWSILRGRFWWKAAVTMPFLRKRLICPSSMISAAGLMSSVTGGRSYTICRREAIFWKACSMD